MFIWFLGGYFYISSRAAGVFLLVRCSPILEFVPNILVFIAIIGAITSFFAATVGGFQYDLKKVIAFSTTSQLGYMVFILGISKYDVSIFHLVNHAFLCAVLDCNLFCETVLEVTKH